AVLTFANKSQDPDQDYLAEGITEEITRQLYRFRSLLVISPESISGYKQRTINPQAVGRELGVHYLVEGSIRRSGDRIRINVQLIEAETGKLLWDERYDGSVADIFDIQDEVAQSIVANVAGRLEDASSQRAVRKRTATLSAYDLVLQGRYFLNKLDREDLLRARELFERAIAIEPKIATAYVGLARTYVFESV